MSMDYKASVPIPQHDFPKFGNDEFTPEEEEKIQRFLEQTIGTEDVCYREGPAKTTVVYVVTQYVVNVANEAFGPGGWSCSVQKLSRDFLEEVDGKYMCGYSAILRVTLKDGSFREDVGYGTGENTVPALALGQGQKSAISDALKRTMRLFGSRLGNCLGDKQHTDHLIESRPGSKYHHT